MPNIVGTNGRARDTKYRRSGVQGVTSDEHPLVTVVCRFEPELFEFIRLLAKQRNVSYASEVRRLLWEVLETQ